MQILKFGLLFAAAIGLSSCSHLGRSKDQAGIKDFSINTPPEAGYVPSERYGAIELPENESVQKWINYFTGRGRPHMHRYLQRSSRYIPMMKGVFRERGMPDDLAYVAMIESGFSATALSHASAVGYWQFIRGTGKHYNLRIDSFVDERRDPILSTQAAASYLDSLYNLFGDWYLALGGYNAGENRIQRAVMMKQSRNFWYLASYKSRKVLPPETRNYIPKFIAAVKIARDPAKYGFTGIDFQPEFNFESVVIDKPISLDLLSKNLGVDYEELRKMNPRYRSDFVPIYADRTNAVRVPVGLREQALAALPNSISAAPQVFAESFEWYRVRRGDTLSGIAAKHGTGISVIRELNDLSGKKTFIRVGQKLKVPDGPRRRRGGGNGEVSAPERKVAASTRVPSSSSLSSGSNDFHVVQSGETLSEIATRYGISLTSLRKLNNLGRRSMIRTGQKLRVADNKNTSTNTTSVNTRKASLKKKQIHVVKRGENLSTIAKRYNISLHTLAEANSIERKSTVFVGSKLKIPGAATASR